MEGKPKRQNLYPRLETKDPNEVRLCIVLGENTKEKKKGSI